MSRLKPCLSVISYNRLAETRNTIMSLAVTGALQQAQVVVYDNRSTDGTAQMLVDLVQAGILAREQVITAMQNIGCPRALNRILAQFRQPGQHFIKVDNDVELLTPGWVDMLVDFLDVQPDVGIVSAWYDGITERRSKVVEHAGWTEIFPAIGHCCIYRGELLDKTGYFDVLADDHLYGFEDNLMCTRAVTCGYKCATLPAVRLRHLQRWNSLDVAAEAGAEIERRDAHVERLRPLYDARRYQILDAAGRYRVGENGVPV